MDITINLAVILFAVCAITFKWMKMHEDDDNLCPIGVFVTISMFVAGLFSLYLNWNFTLSNVFRITFS